MSIANALFSDSQSRVLQWLYGQPDRRFHLSELRRLTRLGSASLQRELNRLADAGLLNSERVGNLRCFTANPSSPVFGELKSLVRKTLGIEPLLREALTQLLPKLEVALIYGSIAKQTDNAQSDIDVMLIGTDLSLSLVLEILMPAENQLGRKINPTCYTPLEFERRRTEPDSFVNRVLAQPIILLIGQINGPASA